MVDTTIRPPGAAPPSTGDSPLTLRRPHRRGRWLVAGIVLVLVAGVATGTVLISNFQPFKAGYKQYGPPTGVSATVTKIDWLDAPPNVQVFRIPAEEGLTFWYRFSIWNHGPLPVTITRFGIPVSEQAGNGLTDVPVALYPDVYRVPSIGGHWVPVRTLTLQPRQMAGVEMQVTVTSCMEQGALTRWNVIPVTFKVFGIERHVLAPMNVQIDLVGTQSAC